MAVEILHYPDGTLYPEDFTNIFVELQDRYVGYLFLFSGKNKDYLDYLSYGLTPTIGFLFKKPNTLTDYLIVVSALSINNPRNYQQGDSSGHSSARFARVFKLLEYLAKVDSNGSSNVVDPIVFFDKTDLGDDYNENILDIKALSELFNHDLLKKLPLPLLNPAWSRRKLLFDSVEQVIEVMNKETNIHYLLGKGCYGLPDILYSQTFTVWETGEVKPSNLDFLEMARRLRNFLDSVNQSQNNKHLKGLDNVYSALHFCISGRDEKVPIKPALILSDALDESRIEIIPSGWDNDEYVQRLPNTKHLDYNGIGNDGSVFKLFRY